MEIRAEILIKGNSQKQVFTLTGFVVDYYINFNTRMYDFIQSVPSIL